MHYQVKGESGKVNDYFSVLYDAGALKAGCIF